MPYKNKINEIIRVNHAGEMGAKVIYDGQILALKIKRDLVTKKIVEDMKMQEISHFNYFDAQIKKHKFRPTIMQPLWGVGGFALGFLTAIIDKKAAMVCTTAVEEVIDQHYLNQISDIENIEKNYNSINNKDLLDLKDNIKKFRDDEIHHRDIAYNNDAKNFIAYKFLSNFIKFTTKFAIEVSKKI